MLGTGAGGSVAQRAGNGAGAGRAGASAPSSWSAGCCCGRCSAWSPPPDTSELFIAATLFVIVGAGVVAALAGLSMALGAFVAGLMLAETEYRKAIEATIEPFKGLLLGVFFFTVGMSIDFRELRARAAAGCSPAWSA